MIGEKKTPRIVLENAYRMAVQALMVDILHVDVESAGKTVSEWWTRLENSAAKRSGSFLHIDPFQTAGELQGFKERELSESEHVVYLHILKSSLDKARRKLNAEMSADELIAMKQPVQAASSRQKSRAIDNAKQVFAGSRN